MLSNEILSFVASLLASALLLILFFLGTFKSSKWARHGIKTAPTIFAGGIVFMFNRPLGAMLITGGFCVFWALYFVHYIEKETKTREDLGKLSALTLYILSTSTSFLFRGNVYLHIGLNLLCIAIILAIAVLSKKSL